MAEIDAKLKTKLNPLLPSVRWKREHIILAGCPQKRILTNVPFYIICRQMVPSCHPTPRSIISY